MLLKLILYLSLLSWTFAQHALAGAPSFEVILQESAPGEIKVILQDKQGYMWFGGRNALLRYNAYKYQSIQAEEQQGEELKKVSPYFVTDIFQDSNGTLWITANTGLYFFDAEHEILKRPLPKEGKIDPFFLSQLQDIEELPSGDLIVGGDGAGLAIFNKTTLKIHWRQIEDQKDPLAEVSLLDRTLQKILVDSKKRIWAANNRGLNLFDPAQKTFTLFIPNPEKAASAADNALRTLVEDKSGHLLGGTYEGGMYIFDTQTHTFRHYMNDPKNPASLRDNAVWQVMIDSEQKIWLSHGIEGISQFDAPTETFTNFNYTFGQPGAPAYGATLALFEDNNKNIWAGHYPAMVSFHDRSSNAITVYRKNIDNPEGISDSNAQSVMEDKQHNLWVSVGDGVNKFDRKTEKFKRYNQSLGNYPASGALSSYMDQQDILWVGTWAQGFSRMNKTTDRFEPMPADTTLATATERHSKKLNDATVWGFCETRDNSFWVATHNAGISRYDADSGVFTKYRSDSTDRTLANNVVWNCYEDSKGRFWIGTSNGLSLMDRDKETFKNYTVQKNNPHSLKSGSVLDIYEDSKGRLWFATNGGLHLYRETTDDFEAYTTDNGFSDNGIRAVIEAATGDLWLGTNNGIIQFNPDTHKVKNYLIVGGKKCGAVNTGAVLMSAQGEVVFGTTDGLVLIDVQKLTSNTLPPPVILTDFKLFAQSVSPNDPHSTLKKVVNRTDSITLDYTKRMFSFEFAALNFRSADKNRYAYKLDGFDQDWREIGTAREAQYTNINPGDYIFNVRASNNDGVWSTEVKTVAVIQLPPPWKTWWAYTLYILLGLLAIAYLIYVQKRKQFLVEEQNRILEIKVSERTRDLAEKNKDIQSLLSNMRQGLFTVEPDGTIHHEYSAFLESIFETKAIAGRDALELLFEHATLGDDLISQVGASVNSIIGEDEMNYDLNSHLLISEYHLALNSKTKILSLDWNPILDNNDNVAKLMVSVRDVTELKALEIEANIKRRELDIVAQLLTISVKKFTQYRESATQYINESLQLVAQCSTFDEAIMGKLFRNMHTVKGNSRTHGLSHIANAAHDAESYFDQVRHAPVEQARERLTQDLIAVARAIEEYNQVYTQVLRRDESVPANGNGVWMSREALIEIQSRVETIRRTAPESYRSILGIINKLFSTPLAEIISSTIESLPAIAVELGKKLPQVIFTDQGILLKESCHALLRDVFTHLLRNSIDHGIEDAETRLRLNKEPFGTILINLSIDEHCVRIDVADNGRGLSLNRLYQKGLEIGLFNPTQELTRLDVASIIFAPGLSTKQGLDTISGRGVGMDAVRQFITEFGGTISIVLDNSDAAFVATEDQRSVAFVLCLLLPKDKCII